MKPSWNGSISFGLVNIPVYLYSATDSERVSFNLLHKKDMGRVGNVRKCKLCGKELTQQDITKGFEVEKDECVEMTDEDFKKAEDSVETGHTIQIMDFVGLDEIDPKFFESPYYIIPGKNADHVYVLLRDALKKTKKVGVAKMVFRDREHLAAVKAEGRTLMLDTMHFANEIKDTEGLRIPAEGTKATGKELEMAEKLIGMMTSDFEPGKYKDTYREAIMTVIDKKAKGLSVKSKAKKPSVTTNVVDIMSKLKASLESSNKRKPTKAKSTPAARKKSRAA